MNITKMEKIPINQRLLRQGINSKQFRTKIINYNNLCDLFELDNGEHKKLKKRYQKRYIDNYKTENKELKKEMKELRYLERRGFFK